MTARERIQIVSNTVICLAIYFALVALPVVIL